MPGRAPAREARTRAKRAKWYLINERGVDAERIMAMDGGHHEETMIEL